MMASLLVSIAVKGALVLAAGAAAARCLGRAPASVRHGVWTATFAALLLVPVLGVAGPAWTVALLPPDLPTTDPARDLVGAVPPVQALEVVRVQESTADDARGAVVSESTSASMSISRSSPDRFPWARLVALLGTLWGLGVVAVASLWMRAFWHAWRLVQDAEPETDGAWKGLLRRVQAQSGARGSVRLLRSSALRVPIAWGFGPPAVVLPASADGWDAERREAVLLHEMAHVSRRDAWTQVVAQAALALHWPNPLAWIAYRRFLDAREQACDDAVLGVGMSGADYASHLVAVARELSASQPLLAAVPSMAGRGALEARVLSVLDAGQRRDRLGRRAMALTAASALAIGLPLAAFQPVPAQPQTEVQAEAPPVAAVQEAARAAALSTLRALRAGAPTDTTDDAEWASLEARVLAEVERDATASLADGPPDAPTPRSLAEVVEEATSDASPAVQRAVRAAAPQIERATERATRDALQRLGLHADLEQKTERRIEARLEADEAATERRVDARMKAEERRVEADARLAERAARVVENRALHTDRERAEAARQQAESASRRDRAHAQQDFAYRQQDDEDAIEEAASGGAKRELEQEARELDAERNGLENEWKGAETQRRGTSQRSSARSAARSAPAARPAPAVSPRPAARPENPSPASRPNPLSQPRL